MPIKHNHTSGRPDNDDPGAIQPSHWNADHDVDGLIGALLALGAAPNVVPYLDGSGNGATFQISAFIRSLMNLASGLAVLQAIGGASLSAPAFTGFPTSATPAQHDNSNKVATTSYVDAALTALINNSPAALDTLNELATALGNDPNFATTITNLLTLKAPLASPNLTGTPSAPTVAGSADSTTKIATTAFVQACVLALAAVSRTGAYSDLTGKPTLGTAAALNVGTGASQVVQLDPTSKLPAVDGSQLTSVVGNLTSGKVTLTGANVSLGAINNLTAVLSATGLGTGTFVIVGKVSLKDTAGAANFIVRLTDGTTVFETSGVVSTTAANDHAQVTIIAVVTNPVAGTVTMQALDSTSGNGLAVFNDSGSGSETTLSWFKIHS